VSAGARGPVERSRGKEKLEEIKKGGKRKINLQKKTAKTQADYREKDHRNPEECGAEKSHQYMLKDR